MKKETLVTNKFKIIGLIVYYVVLFTERLLAVIFSINNGGEYALTSGHYFNYITYCVTVLSLVAGFVLSIKPVAGMLRSLFSKGFYPFEENYRYIVISAMVLLYGGMMHTGFTVAPIQFVAYGFLIAAMVVRTVEKCMEDKTKIYPSVVSVIYLTLFSMTVPVCYIALKLGELTIPFFIAEFAAAFILIPVFGIMLYKFFNDGITSFSPANPLIMFVLSGMAVALKWREEINAFVLIFVILTVLFYLAFGIIARLKYKE
ncbi:MAG: hypothetical protein K6G75_10290 [Lachnospiraceae bacterium]|nr:hypothetical protein [Lachnospiraceae bacterium]